MKEVKLLLERAATKISAAKVLLREGYFDDAYSMTKSVQKETFSRVVRKYCNNLYIVACRT